MAKLNTSTWGLKPWVLVSSSAHLCRQDGHRHTAGTFQIRINKIPDVHSHAMRVNVLLTVRLSHRPGEAGAKESPVPGPPLLPTTFHLWKGEFDVPSGSGYSSSPSSEFRAFTEKIKVTAKTNQVPKQNMPFTLSSIFPPATVSSKPAGILDVYWQLWFKTKMLGKGPPVAAIFTQPSTGYGRNLGPNPRCCPVSTSTSNTKG